MAVHKARNELIARKKAAGFRRRGLNATAKKTKTEGWKVYTDIKGKR